MSTVKIDDANRISMVGYCERVTPEIVVGDSYGGGRVVLEIRRKRTGMCCYLTIEEAIKVRDLLNKALAFQDVRIKRMSRT